MIISPRWGYDYAIINHSGLRPELLIPLRWS